MSTRLLRPGARVIVPAPLALDAFPRIEGRATLVEPVAHIPNLWRVRFLTERRTHLRFIHPAFQDQTQHILAALTDHYRAALDPAILADFSPLNRKDNAT
jgi:hypothetical protein